MQLGIQKDFSRAATFPFHFFCPLHTMTFWRLGHVNLVIKRYNSTAITYGMLRPYQKECIETTVETFNMGCTRQVVSLPVGKSSLSRCIV